MKTMLQKEALFNRFYNGELDKKELTDLLKRLLLDKELNDWFTYQMEFKAILKDQRIFV
jgi:proline dehydrogenase